MKDLLRKAQENLDIACKGREDVCSVRYRLGYDTGLGEPMIITPVDGKSGLPEE